MRLCNILSHNFLFLQSEVCKLLTDHALYLYDSLTRVFSLLSFMTCGELDSREMQREINRESQLILRPTEIWVSLVSLDNVILQENCGQAGHEAEG